MKKHLRLLSLTLMLGIVCALQHTVSAQVILRGEMRNKIREHRANSQTTVQQEDAQTEARAEAAQQTSRIFYERGEKPFGKSFGEWSAEWWQWTFAIPAEVNPILDATGVNAAVGQHSSVWFLTGNFGGVVEREINLPENTTLFFPLLTSVQWNEPGDTATVKELRENNTAFLAATKTIQVELDGKPLPKAAVQRVVSPLFPIVFPQHPVIDDETPGIKYPAVADGYYVMLKPLSVGTHVLKFTGATDDFYTHTEYYICVQPLKAH